MAPAKRKRRRRAKRPLPGPQSKSVRYTLKMLERQIHASAQLDLPLIYRSPKVRGHCENGVRPCPYMSCRYHLAIEVGSDGSLRFPHGHEADDLRAMPQTCALDIADDGGASVADVADLLGLSRQRTAQLELEALQKLALAIKSQDPKDLVAQLPILKKKFAAMGEGANPLTDGVLIRHAQRRAAVAHFAC